MGENMCKMSDRKGIITYMWKSISDAGGGGKRGWAR